MNRKTTFIYLLMTAVLVVATEASARDADTVKRWVEENVPEMMREARLPGFSIAVVKDGETIYADAFGARLAARGSNVVAIGPPDLLELH